MTAGPGTLTSLSLSNLLPGPLEVPVGALLYLRPDLPPVVGPTTLALLEVPRES